MNIAKFFRSLLHGVDLQDWIVKLLMASVAGQLPIPDHIEVNRALVVAINGRKYVVNLSADAENKV